MTESSKATETSRLTGIDALRGILACCVMVYHYLLWTRTSLGETGDRILVAVGLYAVEAFFVISGMSLFFASRSHDFSRRSTLVSFGIRRFFRIAPLFYLVLGATLTLKGLAIFVLRDPKLSMPTPTELLGNLSLMFGLVDPAESLVIAGWSIGIEMVFYLLFPALAWVFLRGDRWSIGLLCGATFAGGVLFATGLLTEELSVGPQWRCYVNVVNHLPFFVAGMLLALRVPNMPAMPGGKNGLLLAALLTAFAVLSATTEQEAALVCGWRRLALSGLTVALVGLVSRRPEGTGVASAVGRRLGDFSFAIYLTHFVVFTVLQQVLPRHQPLLLIGTAVAMTVTGSGLVFRWFETPMIGLGKRLSKGLTGPQTLRTAETVIIDIRRDVAPSRKAA